MTSHRLLAAALAISALTLAALALLAPAAGAAPADSIVFARYVTARVEPAQPCTADNVMLVVTDSCSTCLQVLDISAGDPNSARVEFLLRPTSVCGSGACSPQELRLPLGLRPAGVNREVVNCVVRVPADPLHPGREFSFRKVVGYAVSESCAVTPARRASPGGRRPTRVPRG